MISRARLLTFIPTKQAIFIIKVYLHLKALNSMPQLIGISSPA
jgi:hypothetical protein